MSAQDMTAKGVLEREKLREARARNYRIKRAAGWTCQHDDCITDRGVLVIKNGRGDVDAAYEARCERHLFRSKPNPGQWIDNRRDD